MSRFAAFPLGTALKQSIKNYRLSTFRQDLLSAFVVSLVALPLSMALAIAVGLPPQHGIYTAIVAGIIVPLLGGSIHQVTGPTAAFVVILAPIVAEFGLRGIVWSGLFAGIILIGLGLSRLGKLINYIPYPVTTGFTAGIAVVLLLHSLNDFFGLGIAHLEGSFIDKSIQIFKHFPDLSFSDCLIGMLTLLLLFIPLGRFKWLPNAVIAISMGTLLGYLFQTLGFDVHTIGNHFSYTLPNGHTAAGIPAAPPVISLPTFAENQILTIPSLEEIKVLLFPAFTIAILAALESLLSATVADSLTQQKHDPDAELNALGIGNIVSALSLGIPATGAIARTATNINNGGKTPLASAMHAGLIMFHVLVFAQLISYLPMACLAALLINTAYRMSHYKQFYRTILIAPRSDTVVLLTCFLLTVFVDMVAGVGVGMICAAFLLIKRIIEITKVEFDVQRDETLAQHVPADTVIHRISGPLFFGTIEKAFDRQKFTYSDKSKLIVDLTNVPFIDMTGLVAMRSLLASTANQRRSVHIVSNVPDVTQKIQQKIETENFKEHVYFHQAVEHALASPSAYGISNNAEKIDQAATSLSASTTSASSL